MDYYVTRDFKSEYKGSAVQKIEKSVEEDYVSTIRNNCWKERQTSTFGHWTPKTGVIVDQCEYAVEMITDQSEGINVNLHY